MAQQWSPMGKNINQIRTECTDSNLHTKYHLATLAIKTPPVKYYRSMQYIFHILHTRLELCSHQHIATDAPTSAHKTHTSYTQALFSNHTIPWTIQKKHNFHSTFSRMVKTLLINNLPRTQKRLTVHTQSHY